MLLLLFFLQKPLVKCKDFSPEEGECLPAHEAAGGREEELEEGGSEDVLFPVRAEVPAGCEGEDDEGAEVVECGVEVHGVEHVVKDGGGDDQEGEGQKEQGGDHGARHAGNLLIEQGVISQITKQKNLGETQPILRSN